jgi:SET domain-containing protein
MNKQKLLDNLLNNTYCRIMPSSTEGVGVFAIKDIPKDTNPFINTSNKPLKYKTVGLNVNDIKKLDSGVKKMIKDYIQPDDNKIYYLPYLGLNTIDISFYLNHSNKSNLDIVPSPNADYIEYKTKKVIKKNQELFIDYKKLVIKF